MIKQRITNGASAYALVIAGTFLLKMFRLLCLRFEILARCMGKLVDMRVNLMIITKGLKVMLPIENKK